MSDSPPSLSRCSRTPRPRPISGTWSSAKHTILRFSPTAATSSPSTGAMARASSGGLTLSTCLPLRVFPRHSSSGTTNPLPALLAEHRYDVGFLLQIAEQPDRLAMAAAARQFRRLDRVAAAVGGEDQEL